MKLNRMIAGFIILIPLSLIWASNVLATNSATNNYEKELQRIITTYKHMKPASNLNKNNIGKIVWSNKQINYKEQDNIKTKNYFKLSEPIFGRIFVKYSLGNTPVYSSVNNKPEQNSRFEYQYKLFIDGQEKAVKFGVFMEGKLTGEAGKTWTTWQLAPNPVPFTENFKTEADAWRTATKGLSSGNHNVRFELWSVLGQFRSRQPISIGEFTLEVNQGDRIAAGTPFPKDSYTGNDLATVRSQILDAVSGSMAKKPEKVLKAAVTSNWKQGMNKITKQRYKTISGTLLWPDKDNDSVCRFTTYNFISDHLEGNNWSPLRFKSFCLNCAEGDTQCQQ